MYCDKDTDSDVHLSTSVQAHVRASEQLNLRWKYVKTNA